jgi:hypothetical protein
MEGSLEPLMLITNLRARYRTGREPLPSSMVNTSQTLHRAGKKDLAIENPERDQHISRAVH